MKKLTELQKKIIRTGVCLAVFFAVYIVDKIIAIPALLRPFLYGAIFIGAGYDVLFKAARNISHGKVFDENFLMTVASLGADRLGTSRIVKILESENGR